MYDGSGREAITARGEAKCCTRPRDHSVSTTFSIPMNWAGIKWLIVHTSLFVRQKFAPSSSV